MVSPTLYHLRALDAIWAHLTMGEALPNNQIVRTIPRDSEPGQVPALQVVNVPGIVAQTESGNSIIRSGKVELPN